MAVRMTVEKKEKIANAWAKETLRIMDENPSMAVKECLRIAHKNIQPLIDETLDKKKA